MYNQVLQPDCRKPKVFQIHMLGGMWTGPSRICGHARRWGSQTVVGAVVGVGAAVGVAVGTGIAVGVTVGVVDSGCVTHTGVSPSIVSHPCKRITCMPFSSPPLTCSD